MTIENEGIKARCDRCMWWWKQECRRLPPTVVGRASRWPVTKPDDFCGEYIPTGKLRAEYVELMRQTTGVQ